MSTISTAEIKAGVMNIGNLKCCRCCRVHTLVPHCVVFTSTADGAWNCSPVSSPPSPPSPPYYTFSRYNATLGPGATGSYCPGDSSRYNDCRMSLASRADGGPIVELITWTAHIHYDSTVDSCVIDTVYTLICKDLLTGVNKTYVEYRGTMVLPKLCTGVLDFAGGLTVPMNLYDYTVLDGSTPETQPPILYVTIYPGLCSSLSTTSATVAGVASPQRVEYCQSIRQPLNTNAGCGGFGCKQVCQSTDPEAIEFLSGLDVVVPADECQRCPGYRIPGPVAD